MNLKAKGKRKKRTQAQVPFCVCFNFIWYSRPCWAFTYLKSCLADVIVSCSVLTSSQNFSVQFDWLIVMPRFQRRASHVLDMRSAAQPAMLSLLMSVYFKKLTLSIYFCCFSSHLACMYGCTYSMCVWEVRRQTAVPLLPCGFETRTPADAFITWCLPAWLWVPGPLVFPPVYQGPGILGLPVSAQWQNACEHTWGPGFELQHHNQLIKQ